MTNAHVGDIRKNAVMCIVDGLVSNDPEMRKSAVVAAKYMSQVRPGDRGIQNKLYAMLEDDYPYPEVLEAAGFLLVPGTETLNLLLRHSGRPEAVQSIGLLLAIEMVAQLKSNQIMLAQAPPPPLAH